MKKIAFLILGLLLIGFTCVLAAQEEEPQKATTISGQQFKPKEVKMEFSSKHIPPGTIDATLKRFSDRGPLMAQNGKYFIPDFNFSQVQEMFNQPSNE